MINIDFQRIFLNIVGMPEIIMGRIDRSGSIRLGNGYDSSRKQAYQMDLSDEMFYVPGNTGNRDQVTSIK